MTVICYATQRDYQVKIEMYPANVCYNLVLAAERAGETAGYAETSRDFTFNASAAHDENSREVYVLVIGERPVPVISDFMVMKGILLHYLIKWRGW